MAPSSSSGVRPRSRISAWLHHHYQAAGDSITKLLREPIASALTVLVIGVALALPSFALSLASLVSVQVERLDSPPQLSVLVTPQSSYEAALALAERLEKRPGIDSVKVIDRDKALAEFVTATGLDSLVGRLARNPLPHTLWIYPKANLRPAGLDRLSQDLVALPGVAEVIVDSRWLDRLEAIVELARVIALTLGLVMAVGVVLTLGNTLRLGIESRRDEIVVIKLIGGSDAFARRPFLYTGLFTGALGGLAAGLLNRSAFLVIEAPVSRLFQLYDQSQMVPSPPLTDVFVLLAVGGLLGWISAWYSAQLHVTRIRPN